MKPLTQEQLEKLADYHIRHFKNLLSQRSGLGFGINEAECEMYLDVWLRIRVKTWNDLNGIQLQEIGDAVYSGEFDDMLLNSDPR